MAALTQERTNRYLQKLGVIEERSAEIGEWSSSADEFAHDAKTRLATYKAFQDATEACMDIVAMLCKDIGIAPHDDYVNIESLNGKVLTKEVCSALAAANGLRNRLVHRYNRLDDTLAFESIGELMPRISEFAEEVKAWMKKRSKS